MPRTLLKQSVKEEDAKEAATQVLTAGLVKEVVAPNGIGYGITDAGRQFVREYERLVALLRSESSRRKDNTWDSMNVYVVMPAHNEEKKIASVIESMPYDIVKKVIVVDDDSDDNTAEIAQGLGAHVIRHEEKKGVGAAYKTGYGQALKEGAGIIVTVHSDGQHDPREIPKLIQPIVSGEADYVLGSRLKADAIDMSRIRLFGNRALSWFVRVMTGCPTTDSQTGYHAITGEALMKLRYDRWSDGFPVEVDAIGEASRRGLRIMEVPVRCIYSDRSHVRATRDGAKILWSTFKASVRPLESKKEQVTRKSPVFICEICRNAPARTDDILCVDCSRAYGLLLEVLHDHQYLAPDDLEHLGQALEWKMNNTGLLARAEAKAAPVSRQTSS
jgi:glycosyltransferase involved in cell wall biosynthesis